MSDTSDHLTIIAGERGALTPADRATIKRGANELEWSYRQLLLMQEHLIEVQGNLLAARERIYELERRPDPLWFMSSGWVTVQMRDDDRWRPQ